MPVTIHHSWYSNWGWMACNDFDKDFLKAIHGNLNDDCLREIIKYLDLRQLIYFGQFNNRFKAIAEEKMSRLRISPSTVTPIGLMDFRYLIHLYGDSLKKISLSLHAFASVFGCYCDRKKKCILKIIYDGTGPKLRRIFFHDFDLIESDTIKYERLFFERGTEITFF